eukprot:SAG11_NODE_3019_length_2759_cov_1.335338_3_plen_195_part_00
MTSFARQLRHLAAARLISALCARAQRCHSAASGGTAEAERRLLGALVAAGLQKAALVEAVEAIALELKLFLPDQAGCRRAMLAKQAQRMLQQLLKDTDLLTALEATVQAAAAEVAATDEAAAPLSEAGSLTLARKRVARLLQGPNNELESAVSAGAATPPFYKSCSLSAAQSPLAALLAPLLLTCRKHRTATAR